MEELQGYGSGTASFGAFNDVRVPGRHAHEVFFVRSVDLLSRKVEGDTIRVTSLNKQHICDLLKDVTTLLTP